MAIEVLRLDTEQVLKGQLNGRALQQSISLAAEEDVQQAGSQQQSVEESPASESYAEFISVADAQGILTFDAPAAWEDIQDSDWVFNDETVGIRLDISPDLENFYDDWSIPGAILRYSESMPDQMAVEQLLDEYTLDASCTKGERDTISAGELAGSYQFWDECGETPTSGVVVALAPSETNAYYVLLELYGAEERDRNAWDTILNSLVVASPAAQSGAAQSAATVTTSADSPLFDLVDTRDLVYSYVAIEDPAISALFPAEYGDITTAEWMNSAGEPLGFILTAAPDIDEFNASWNTPGIIVKSAIGISEELDADEMLKDEALAETCTYDDRYLYTHEAFDRTYNIVFDVYNECGGTDSSYAVAMAQSDPLDQVVFVDFVSVSDADVEAFNTFLDSFYLDSALAGATSDTGDTASSAANSVESGPAFVSVSDDTDTISLRVPETWEDLLSEEWDLGDGPIGVSFSAAPDVQQFNDTWDTAGVFIGVSEMLATLTPADVLDFFDLKDDCTYDDRYDYETSALAGVYDVWNACGGVEGGAFVVLAATPLGEDAPMIVLYTNLPTAEDADLFADLVNTLAVAGAVQSVQAAQQEEVLSGASAIVIVDRLNVRSGPGTNFNRVGTVNNGDALVVSGQINNCSWLQVATPAGVEGWVSGSSQYVTLNTRCTDIPVVEAPAASDGQSSGGQSSSATAGSQASGATTTAKGCYTFQNQIGPELTITFTNRSTSKSETFVVPSNGEIERCFDPGRYTYTLDAPPPWGSTNGELAVEAGDVFLFPISPE
jgi:serine protease Do